MSTSPDRPPHAESSRKPRGTKTIADYMALPEDGKRYELLDGELIEMNSPQDDHQTVVGNIFAALLAHARRHDLGRVMVSPYDVVLEPRSVCQPDVLFVAKARLPTVMGTGRNAQGAPDLGVEVLSPSREKYDLSVKLRIYRKAGMPHYWIVDPQAKTVAELLLEGRKYVHNADHDELDDVFCPVLFPGLALPLTEIFREVP